MRFAAFALFIGLSGCAAHAAAPVLAPSVDDDAAGAPDDTLSSEPLRVFGHPVSPHEGCTLAAQPHGGVVRCPGRGHVWWIMSSQRAPVLQERDLVARRVADFAAQQRATVKQLDFDCELAARPGACRAYVIAGPSGTWSEVAGYADDDRGSLLVECTSRPGAAAAMKPVCGELIGSR